MTWSQVGRRSPSRFPLTELVLVNALLFGLLLWFVGWDPSLITLFLVLNVLPIVTDWWKYRKAAADPFGELMR